MKLHSLIVTFYTITYFSRVGNEAVSDSNECCNTMINLVSGMGGAKLNTDAC